MPSRGFSINVHLLVSCRPKISISLLVSSLKGVASHHVRIPVFPYVLVLIWEEAFWSQSYRTVDA